MIIDETYPWDPIACGSRLRVLDSGHVVWLVSRLFTWALVVGPDGELGFEKHWCYATIQGAIQGARDWDGNHPETEPTGWIRDPYTGRRRPDGDPAREYVAL
jgi:hypothetical protein